MAPKPQLIIKSPPELKKEGIVLNEIITVYAIIDDLLKGIGHEDDCRRTMSDAEIITTASGISPFAQIKCL